MNDLNHLKVMTFNIRHANGLDGRTSLRRIAEEIRSASPDIVALQEVDRRHPRSGFRDQALVLGRELGMASAFSPSLNLGLFQYGNATLSRFPILSKEIRYMPGSERRSILTVRLDVRGEIVTVVNTHLGVWNKEKERQLPILMDTLSRLDRPSLLMGDLNMPAGSRYMRDLKTIWTKVNLQEKGPTFHYGGEIDHVLSCLVSAKTTAWVQQTRASDHNPVIAELQWKPSLQHSAVATAAAGQTIG